jgi:hypothetical protein
MTDNIPIGRTRGLRESGFDEYWLQDQIAENPACLGLGELELVSRERKQSSGGRLDLLLKDPGDDSMYEVDGNACMWLHKRSNGKSLLNIWFSEAHVNEAESLFDEANISYVRKDEVLKLTVDAQMIESNAAILQKIVDLVKKSWE